MLYSGVMALTIKNPETIALTRELARKTGQTQTGAITEAVRAALERESQPSYEEREARVNAVMQEIWATMTPERKREIHQNMDDLYDEWGLPA